MKVKDIITTIIVLVSVIIQFYDFLIVASASNITIAIIILFIINVAFLAVIPKHIDETLVAIIYLVVCFLTTILLIQFLNALGIRYSLPQLPPPPPLIPFPGGG